MQFRKLALRSAIGCKYFPRKKRNYWMLFDEFSLSASISPGSQFLIDFFVDTVHDPFNSIKSKKGFQPLKLWCVSIKYTAVIEVYL